MPKPKEKFLPFDDIDEKLTFQKLETYPLKEITDPDALLNRVKRDFDRGYWTQGEYDYITSNVDSIVEYYRDWNPFIVRVQESQSMKKRAGIVPNYAGIIHCPWPAVESNLGIEQLHAPDECYTARCPYFGKLYLSGNVECMYLDRRMLWS